MFINYAGIKLVPEYVTFYFFSSKFRFIEAPSRVLWLGGT